ncbi:hypothetical protein ACO0LO_24730 [Undibacterium sp. TJN25]|uniref:hypothetical protein n=1 Tax=Undibacterium sp. TJN25 TaxID=3413056 RepID=UPI003BF21382
MIDMKILISIFLLGISSLASANVINNCIDAEGKKITADQACEKLGLKDAGDASLAPLAAASLPTTTAASSAASSPEANPASSAESFLPPPLPKVTVERKLPPPPPPNPWMELIHNDYSLLLLMGACPFLFAFFWYVFEYRMRRS